MSTYPMNATDCYECLHFVQDGHYTCQLEQPPHYSADPTDDPLAIYLVPHPIDWRHPDGKAAHCNSFIQKFKETLF